MLGPTGGYLIGMIPASIGGSLVMKSFGSRMRLASLLSAIVSTLLIYLVGLPWLSAQMELPLPATLAAGLLPFLPGDVLKIIVASAVVPVIRPRVSEMLERE